MPKPNARTFHSWPPLPRTVKAPTPQISTRAWPNTTWWMCRPPGVTLPGHQLVPRRIIRTLKRMKRKEASSPTSSRNSGSRPVSTIRSRYASSSDCHMAYGTSGRRRGGTVPTI
ncbi:hypothetical protein ACFQ1I_17935 [Kitasatospora arboriphila]